METTGSRSKGGNDAMNRTVFAGSCPKNSGGIETTRSQTVRHDDEMDCTVFTELSPTRKEEVVIRPLLLQDLHRIHFVVPAHRNKRSLIISRMSLCHCMQPQSFKHRNDKNSSIIQMHSHMANLCLF